MRRGIDTTEASNGMKYDNILHTVELDGSVVSVFHPNAQSTDTSANAALKMKSQSLFSILAAIAAPTLGPEHRQEPAH